MLAVLCPEIFLHNHQRRPFFPCKENCVILNPSILYSPYCSFFLQLSSYFEVVSYSSLDHPSTDLKLLSSFGHKASAIVCLDERSCCFYEFRAFFE